MPASHAELFAPLPHLVAIARLPLRVDARGVTLVSTGEVDSSAIVGTLRSHVAAYEWRVGRRRGAARIEVTRSHVDRCSIVVVLDGLPIATAHAVAEQVRVAIAGTAPAARSATAAPRTQVPTAAASA